MLSNVCTSVWEILSERDQTYGQDWAIHILADRLGDQHGYFGSQAMTKDYLNRGSFYNFGYAGDLPTGLALTALFAPREARCSSLEPVRVATTRRWATLTFLVVRAVDRCVSFDAPLAIQFWRVES